MTGIPPATAASNLKFTLLLSAEIASSWPYIANIALLAVTTCFPCFMAASVACLALPSSPPINSTKTSMSSLLAKLTGSFSHS